MGGAKVGLGGLWFTEVEVETMGGQGESKKKKE